VSNFACLDAFAGIVGALTERTITLVRRCLSESLLKELGRAHVLVTSVLLVLHQRQLAVRPLLLREEVPHRVLLKLQHGHKSCQTGQVRACSSRRLPQFIAFLFVSPLLGFFASPHLVSFPFEFFLVSLLPFVLLLSFLVLLATLFLLLFALSPTSCFPIFPFLLLPFLQFSFPLFPFTLLSFPILLLFNALLFLSLLLLLLLLFSL